MSGAMPPLPQYAFMARCLVKAQGQLYLYLHRTICKTLNRLERGQSACDTIILELAVGITGRWLKVLLRVTLMEPGFGCTVVWGSAADICYPSP